MHFFPGICTVLALTFEKFITLFSFSVLVDHSDNTQMKGARILVVLIDNTRFQNVFASSKICPNIQTEIKFRYSLKCILLREFTVGLTHLRLSKPPGTQTHYVVVSWLLEPLWLLLTWTFHCYLLRTTQKVEPMITQTIWWSEYQNSSVLVELYSTNIIMHNLILGIKERGIHTMRISHVTALFLPKLVILQWLWNTCNRPK